MEKLTRFHEFQCGGPTHTEGLLPSQMLVQIGGDYPGLLPEQVRVLLQR